MPGFEIISPDREDLQIAYTLAETDLPYRFRGSRPIVAECSFGKLLFQHYSGEGFDIWKNNYRIDRPIRLIGRADTPILELSVVWESAFSTTWKGLGKSNLVSRQIEMYHAPYMDNLTQFPASREYSTFDLHFHRALLEQYAPDFPLLAEFMNQVHHNEPATLFDGKQFTSPAIDGIIRAMIQYQFRDELAPAYYDHSVHLLLIHLLEKISGFNPQARRFPAEDLEKARLAREMLTREIGKSYTIKELCRELHTNPFKLKTSFKQVYGTSIGRYKRNVQMEQARILLETTRYSMDEIAFRLGYSSSQSFSTAFRNHFKSVPSHWRKRAG